MAETNQQTNSGTKPSPESGAAAGQRAKRAFEDWRQRTSGAPPFPTGGPPFGGFPMPGPFGFPPGFGSTAQAIGGQSAAVAGSLFNSLTTTLRLALELINANLEGMLAGSYSQGGGYGHGGGHGHDHGCGCDCGQDCCEQFGASCGCCRPSVNNCGCC